MKTRGLYLNERLTSSASGLEVCTVLNGSLLIRIDAIFKSAAQAQFCAEAHASFGVFFKY